MSESAIRNDRSVTPLLVAALAVFSFSILDAMLKGATARVPVLEVIFLRFVAGPSSPASSSRAPDSPFRASRHSAPI
jgi:hypothetical protein